ncbi:MAG: DUF2948 family protein [Pseudomonadota bacterium]
MTTPKTLRLMAQDQEDLEVISAAVQDAVSQVGNFAYKARQRRFSLELNRFRWEHESTPKQRVRSILSIDNVLAARVRGVPQNQPELVISVLQLRFEPGEDAPAGRVVVLLAGDGEIALDVEALDVTLLDSETAWPTRKTPKHGKD